ncbi:S-adenosyl-L-methionine-dependent methyltransferase [Westerdykella ornata]|uniref:S-adenosyl-L-methionine-dependent methyltransferase n=1 Tax=Westerdykella ornata TaxID=318751 RepID=A0A6A6JRG1_WESOR|nr:S-adenosyl-L-methionine-dependent methyltransferase [Westerdykella ornata]KAF2278458.1 S-adenosyl-L-methionine-dependent methyltransferase [Westerdykella ornata]
MPSTTATASSSSSSAAAAAAQPTHPGAMALGIPIPQRDASPSPSPVSSVDGLSPRSIIEPDDRSTRSVNQSIFDFVCENGRTYHRYQAGSYLFPNDQSENERLDLQYEILKVLLKGRNYFAPLKDPRKILDIGTGTGKWAIEMGNAFPKAEVTGTDLSPIQPEWVPNNVKFVIDDANEEDWMLDPMDYIHTRVMLGCFEDFREIIAKAYRHLKPGGWMESQEYMPTVYCDDGTMSPDYAFAEWTQTQDRAAMNLGKPLRIANKLKRWYEQAGFVDVHEEVFKLPINSWPKDPQFKMLGRFSETNLLDGLQAFSLQLFQKGLHWTKEEIEVYLVHVRKALSDRNVHAYHKIYVVWGRKPFDHELGVPSPPNYPPPPPPRE